MPRLTRSIGSNSDIVNNKRLWLTKLHGSYNSRTENCCYTDVLVDCYVVGRKRQDTDTMFTRVSV